MTSNAFIHAFIHASMHARMHPSMHYSSHRARVVTETALARQTVGNRIESNHLPPPPPPSSSTSFARRPLSLRSPRLSAYAVPLATTTTLHAYPCQRPYARMACLQSAGSECSDDDDDDDDDDVMTTTTTTCDGTRARGVARRRDVRRAVTLDGFISCIHHQCATTTNARWTASPPRGCARRTCANNCDDWDGTTSRTTPSSGFSLDDDATRE